MQAEDQAAVERAEQRRQAGGEASADTSSAQAPLPARVSSFVACKLSVSSTLLSSRLSGRCGLVQLGLLADGSFNPCGVQAASFPTGLAQRIPPELLQRCSQAGYLDLNDAMVNSQSLLRVENLTAL